MRLTQATITVIGEHQCTFYKVEDIFRLSGQALTLPCERPACMILMDDIRRIQPRLSDSGPNISFYCSGCAGLIKLDVQAGKENTLLGRAITAIGDLKPIPGALKNLSIFEALKEENVKDLLPFLKFRRFSSGDTIIKKGERGSNLFIIISGRVEVLNDLNIVIAVLGRGEIFGEMSLLSGDPAGATIKAVESGSFLYINGNYFRQIVSRFPPIQMYLIRLLAKRISRQNIEMIRDGSSAIRGKLSEVAPQELCQTMNINQKTGVLIFDLLKGEAKIYFNDGEVVGAEYDSKQEEEAFLAIMDEKKGRFRFDPGLPDDRQNAPVIGNLMKLLMISDQNRADG